MKKTSYGFTLVELVMTMAVVAILGTLATIYVFEAFGTSRDSARITSIGQIVQNMDLFKVDTGSYPEPDDFVSVTLSGSELWKQGVFGNGVSQKLGVYGSDYPQDPLYEIDYTYSVTNKNSEYQIGGIIEDTKDSLTEDLISLAIPSAHAAVTTAYVRGNYNGFLARAIVGTNHYFVVSPSIIASDLTNTDFNTIIDTEKLVFDEFFNVPSSYQNSFETFGGFSFFPEEPVIFSGALNDLQNRNTLTEFINEVKFIYGGSQIATFPKYMNLIEGDTFTSTKKILESVFGVPFAAHSCNDILANGEGLADGFYVVDSDEGEDGSVYCDMTTGDGGWTREGINFITNGEFEGGNGIASEWWSNPNNTIVNLGTDNTPVVSGYAVHQTSNPGWSDSSKSASEYEVHFDDADPDADGYQFPAGLLQPGYEIRMTTWVRNDDDGATWSNCFTGACGHNPYPGYMFHNRLYYIDGTNEVNGTVEVLDTVTTADGNTWELQRVRKRIRKTPSGFNWYIGYGAELDTDLYFTGVKLEIFYK